MHDERYVGTFLHVWIAKMRKKVYKRHLAAKAEAIQRDRRNRLFLKWLCVINHMAVTDELSRRLFKQHESRVASTAMKALKFNAMRRKRERLISKIIYEKRYQLLAMRTLDLWRDRLEERVTKN